MKILFLHGWNSVPGGVKPTYLKDHGYEVINPALPHEDFAQAVRIAQAEFDQHQPQVVVGSSRGRGGRHEHRQRRGEARAALPGVEEVRDGQDGEAGHRDPVQPGPTTWFPSPTPRNWSATAGPR